MLREVIRFKRGGWYAGGNARMLEKVLGCRGEEVLYVGDHIFTDVNMAKKGLSWRTCMILQELEREVTGLAYPNPSPNPNPNPKPHPHPHLSPGHGARLRPLAGGGGARPHGTTRWVRRVPQPPSLATPLPHPNHPLITSLTILTIPLTTSLTIPLTTPLPTPYHPRTGTPRSPTTCAASYCDEARQAPCPTY